MFPWVYGFKWSPGYIAFLLIFFTVVLVVASTLLVGLVKTVLNFRSGRAYSLQWTSLFQDLPRSSRACRHAMTGELPGRICEFGFDCRECVKHSTLLAKRENVEQVSSTEELLGISIPLDRFYHRGHCWVQPLQDGTVLVGLDELGRRLMGRLDKLYLPEVGTHLYTNSKAFEAERNGSKVRVLAPVDSEVIARGGAEDYWILKLRVKMPLDTRHLLCGSEVRVWYQREIDRLQLLSGGADGIPALADGGELLDDLGTVFTGQEWGTVCGEMLLDA